MGIDSASRCLDPDRFAKYPHVVRYDFNSRGFRDSEWPQDTTELKQAIWCIGDSFTVGLGQPYAHIWPQTLASRTGRRTINISMDGASNDWISRQANQIAAAVNPENMVVMWSYLHRRETHRPDLTDLDRRTHCVDSSHDDDRANFRTCQERVLTLDTNIVQLIIPGFEPGDLQRHWMCVRGPDWPIWAPRSLKDLANLPRFIRDELAEVHGCWQKFVDVLGSDPGLDDITQSLKSVIPCHQVDWARDGHHFDLLTAQNLAEEIVLGLR